MSNRACRADKRSRANVPFAITLLRVVLAAGLSSDQICGDQQTCRAMPAPGFDAPSMASHRGEYVNSVYEFAVSIPNGLIGQSSPPPAPSHGFGILLGPKGGGYLWVDGSWNSLEYQSSEMAARDISVYMKERGATVSQSKVNSWKLGKFPATRVTVWYRCPDSREVFINEEVVAVSLDKSTIWKVGLDTRVERYDRDVKIFEAVLKSWRYTSRKL